MADFRTYMKAARNTARRQAPAAKDALRRTAQDGVREVQIHGRAASKAFEHQAEAGRHSAARGVASAERGLSDATKTLKASAIVAERHYRSSRLGTRLLHAFRDAFIMAASLGAIWFVVSRIVPIPITVVIIAAGLLMIARLTWAVTHNPYAEAERAPAETEGP